MDTGPSQTKPRRLGKWLRRLLVAGFLLIVALVIFHRPLLRLTLSRVVPMLAEKQGLALNWDVGGTILGDLTLSNINVSSDSGDWLSVASADRVAVDYDLWKLLQEGPADVLQSVTLHDATVEMDLQKMPAKAPKPAPEKKKDPNRGPPPLVWPETIDIQNVTLDLTLPSGKHIQLTNFSLRVGRDQPGEISWDRLTLEPGKVDLADIRAGVDWGDRTLALTDLQLPFDLKIDRLEADLAQLTTAGALTATLDAHLSTATVHLETDIEALGSEDMTLDAVVRIADLDSSALIPLGLPAKVEFQNARVGLAAKGNPKQPRNLTAHLDLQTDRFATAGIVLDASSTNIKLAADGKADGTVSVKRTVNEVDLDLTAALPETWSAWQKIDWQATLDATLPEVATVLSKPLPLTADLSLTATADGQGKTARQVRGNLTGDTLQWQQWKLPLLNAQFTIDGQQATVTLPPLPLGQGNTIAADVKLDLISALPLDLQWDIHITDPATLLTNIGRPALNPSPSGTLTTSGTTSLIIEQVKAGDYSNALADFTVKGTAITYDGTHIETIDLGAVVKDGMLKLSPWKIDLDGDQGLSGIASLKLQSPWTFTAQADVDLPELARFSPLLEASNAPSIDSGAFKADLNITGDLSPWTAQGKITADLAGLSMKILPESVDLHLDATFADTTATLNSLSTQLGPWNLQTHGTASPELIDLKSITLSDTQQTLLSGHARVPVDLMKSSTGQPMEVALIAKDLRVQEVAKSAGIDRLPGGLVNAKIDLAGRLENATGQIQIQWADLLIPQQALTLDPATVNLDLQLAGEALTLDGIVTQPPLKPLTLKASARATLASIAKNPQQLRALPIQASVDLPTSDLSFLRQLKPDLIKDLPLTLALHADVTGTATEPRVNATLQADSPRIGLASADMPSVRDVRVRLVANDSTLQIEDLSAMLAGGNVGISGSIDATQLSAPSFDLSLTARQALVFRSQDGTVRANADLTCTGTAAAARVAGSIEAVRGYVFKELDFIQFSLPNKLPPPPPNTARAQQQIELPPTLKDWTFDVAIKTQDPVKISGNIAIAQVSADAKLSGTGAQPLLTGQATIDQGLIQLPFSRMKISRGVVTLNPKTPFSPNLDIRGESRIESYDVTLYVYGSTAAPQTRFTSNPPLAEAQIASLVATGAVLDDSSSDVASRAASQAAFLAAKQLYRKVLNKPKVIEEEPPKLSVTYRPAGSGQNDDAVQATYDLTDRVQVTGRFRQSGQMKMLLGYLLHFGEAARALDEPDNSVIKEKPPSE